MISPSQYGFEKGKYTEDAVINLTYQTYKSLIKKFITVNTFMEHQKTFDTVNHNFLLKKSEITDPRCVLGTIC